MKNNFQFVPRFALNDVPTWAQRYIDTMTDAERMREDKVITIGVRTKNSDDPKLSVGELYAICRWKSPRRADMVKMHSDTEVMEITNLAFTTPIETLRLHTLTALHGVSWRTASAILHLCHKDHYPIMDVRAFASLGLPNLQYTPELWRTYTDYCRTHARALGVSMREFDRALWQFDDESNTIAQ